MIERAGHILPCAGRETDGRLTGTFASQGNVFEFTATLQGGALILQSGAVTLPRMKRTPDLQLCAQS
jgi:hypothetical protein